MSRPRACYNWELRRYGSGDGAGAHLPPNGVAAVAAACGAASGGRSLSLTARRLHRQWLGRALHTVAEEEERAEVRQAPLPSVNFKDVHGARRVG